MQYAFAVAAALLLTTTALRAADLSPGPLSFTMAETAGATGERLASVSFPFAPGEMPDLPGVNVKREDGQIIPAQCRILNRHRNGSVRRAMIRFPWKTVEGVRETFTLAPLPAAGAPRGLVSHAGAADLDLRAGGRTIRTAGTALVISRGEKEECRVAFSGLQFPFRFVGPEVSVIEDGPYFSWVSLTYFGGAWNVYLEVQADYTGQVRVTARLRMMQGGATTPPQFGLELSGLPGRLDAGGVQALPFNATTADSGPRRFRFWSGDQTTVVLLPEGAQIRQGRVKAVAGEGGTQFRLLRDASLDQTVVEKDKQFYEGQERSVAIDLPGPAGIALSARGEIPALRRSVAVEGLPLVSWGKLQRIRELNTENALKLICRDGDQYGDVTSGASLQAPHWSITGLTRIDTGLDMLEDYYRGGDWRLRDLAVGWAENWVTLKQYRGWDMNSFGGERYTMTSWQYIPSFNQKGIMMVARAYEETGDPRHRESALAFADRAVKQMQTRYFISGTGFAPTSIGGDANIRPGYLCRDLVLMYRWTGNTDYLTAARQIMHGLAALRVGGDGARGARALDGEHTRDPAGGGGFGLLREGYSDPYSSFDRLVTGTDLGVTEDNSDHLKPFILNYLLEGAQYLYEETKDPIAQATMKDLSDFMLGAMEPGGIWNYAQRHASEGNSIGHMTVEIANTLLRSYTLTGDARYKDAAFSAFHLVCKAFDAYGTMIDGVRPPEDRKYFYPDDHCDLDFYRGTISLQGITRDPIGYLFCAVDRMLRIDPKADDILLSPPSDPRHKWVIEGVPIADGPISHEIGYCYIASTDFGKGGDSESGGKSDLVLLEDGKPLGPPHSLHADIRTLGKGRYSAWTRNGLYMSASDNSDPRTNGRKYAYYFGSPGSIPGLDRVRTLDTGGRFAGRKPHPSVALYDEALKAESEGRYADAVATWDKVLQQWPDSSPELYRQIGLWEKTGDEGKALATCRRFIVSFPKHSRTPSVRLKLAGRLIAGGQKAESQQILQDAARDYAGTPWGEEATTRLWHELGVGAAPATVVHALPGTQPKPSALRVLDAATGQVAGLALQIGAAYDDKNLYLKLVMPLGTTWPSPDYAETMRLFLDPRGEMTDYGIFIVNSQGGRQERGLMWHNRGEGIKDAEGWQGKVTRDKEGWTADLTIPFAKLGFRPEPGRRTWRFGFRWDSLSGMRFWRPSMYYNTRPQDCGWVAFD